MPGFVNKNFGFEVELITLPQIRPAAVHTKDQPIKNLGIAIYVEYAKIRLIGFFKFF